MLREDQILRYSRQILLGAVGGVGQERLLGLKVDVLGDGPAVDAAVAYLAAGGTRVRPIGAGALQRADVGFLCGAADVGAVRADAWARAAERLNPDARGAEPADVVLAHPPADGAPAPAAVMIGHGAAGTQVTWTAPGGCTACLRGATAGQTRADGPEATAAGALAALVLQQIALGIAPALGAVRISPDGGVGAVTLERCGGCR